MCIALFLSLCGMTPVRAENENDSQHFVDQIMDIAGNFRWRVFINPEKLLADHPELAQQTDWQDFIKLVKQYQSKGDEETQFQDGLRNASSNSERIKLLRAYIEDGQTRAHEFAQKSESILDPIQYRKALNATIESPALTFDPAVNRLAGVKERDVEKILELRRQSVEKEIESIVPGKLTDEEIESVRFQSAIRKLDRVATHFKMLPLDSRQYLLNVMFPGDDTPGKLVAMHSIRQQAVASVQDEQKKQEVNKAFARLFAAIESKDPADKP